MYFEHPEVNHHLGNTTTCRNKSKQHYNDINDRKIKAIMERSSILVDRRDLDFDLYYTEKTTEYLCENCGVILGSKQALKCHMVIKHSEKVMTYQCSKCPTTCNRLDNMRHHIKKHPGQTTTPKTIMYEIKQMSPEPSRPRRQIRKTNTTPVITKPYFSQPINSNDYIYQQSLRPNQRSIPWKLILIDIPEKTTKKNVPPNPRLLQDLEDMNKQLLAELEVSSSSSESSLDSPIQDHDDLQDHPEDWLVIDEL